MKKTLKFIRNYLPYFLIGLTVSVIAGSTYVYHTKQFNLGSGAGGSLWFLSGGNPTLVTNITDGCAEWSSNSLTSTGVVCGSGSGGGLFLYEAEGTDIISPNTASTSNSAGLKISYITATSTATSSSFAAGITVNNDTITDFTGTGLVMSGNSLTTTLGTSIDISDETNLAGDTEIVLTNDTLSIAASIARDSELHDAVTITGEDYLSLATQQITANAINADNLSATDFGDFTCNGTTCSLDANTVQDNEIDYTAVTLADFTNDAGFLTQNDTITLSGDVTGSGTSSITTSIASGVIIEPDLNTDDSPVDGDILTYDTTGTNFVWETILDLVNTITGAVDWGGITSLEIPNGANPTVNATGEVAVETASSTFRYYGSSREHVVYPYDVISITNFASTSVMANGTPSFSTGTSTIKIRNYSVPVTVGNYYCETGSGEVSFHISDGTNDTDVIRVTTSGVEDDGTIANASFNPRGDMFIEVGSASATGDDLTCTIEIYITP